MEIHARTTKWSKGVKEIPMALLLILVSYASSMKLSLLDLNSYEVMSILLI